jgi:hypothetical protein
MPVKLPTKPTDAPPEKPVENKFDPFRPEMPQIQGVGHGPLQSARVSGGLDTLRLMQIGGIVGAVVLIGAIILWWVRSKPHGTGNSSTDAEVADQPVPAPPMPNPATEVQEDINVAATVDELSKPWAAKKFNFVKPFTRENIAAMVIRLPGGELWAFSLQGPLGRCELEYVTDLEKLASQYRFSAGHPMVVSPCDSTVYDPLKVGPLGGNTWARGEIVKGNSLRPPISIDVKVRGRSIIADGIE